MSGVGPGWGGQQPNIKGGVFSLYEQKQRRVTVSHTYTYRYRVNNQIDDWTR